MTDSTKLRIFNVAATVFNIRPFTSEEMKGSDEDNPNLSVFSTLLDPALDMAMREYDWSFLLSELDMGEDLGAKERYSHSYKLPEGLFRLCSVIQDGDYVYKRVGNMLLLKGELITAYGIMEEFDETAVPRDFWDLTGYALAFMASNSISAGDSKANTAMALYQKLAGNMMFNDAQNDGKTSMMDGEHEWRV